MRKLAVNCAITVFSHRRMTWERKKWVSCKKEGRRLTERSGRGCSVNDRNPKLLCKQGCVIMYKGGPPCLGCCILPSKVASRATSLVFSKDR